MGYVAIAYYCITISRPLQGQHNILPSYGSASNSLTHKCQVLISNSIALEHLHWSMLMLWCNPSERLQLFCGHYLCLYWSVYLLLYLYCFRRFCSVLLPATAPVRPCSKTVGFRRRSESYQAWVDPVDPLLDSTRSQSQFELELLLIITVHLSRLLLKLAELLSKQSWVDCC